MSTYDDNNELKETSEVAKQLGNITSDSRVVTYMVTTAQDGGDGSLRKAIADMSLDAIYHNSSKAKVVFDIDSDNPIITLKDTLPTLCVNLELSLDGSNLKGGIVTIDGNNSCNAFCIENGKVNMSNLEIRNCAIPEGEEDNTEFGTAIFVNDQAEVNLQHVKIINTEGKESNLDQLLATKSIFVKKGGVLAWDLPIAEKSISVDEASSNDLLSLGEIDNNAVEITGENSSFTESV